MPNPLPLTILQSELFSRLSAAGAPVTDAVTAHTALPYVTLGEATVTDWSTKTSVGYEIEHQLHIWSDYAGMAEAARLVAVIETALIATPYVLAGYAVTLRGPGQYRLLRDRSGLRHGVLRFRFAVECE